MKHEQLSMFDMFAEVASPEGLAIPAKGRDADGSILRIEAPRRAPVDAPVDMPVDAPATVQDAKPVAVSIQASMKCADGSYRIYGTVRTTAILQSWRPTARDALEWFPISLSWDIAHGMLDRGAVIDLFAHELDGEGRPLHMLADAVATINAADIIDAAKSS